MPKSFKFSDSVEQLAEGIITRGPDNPMRSAELFREILKIDDFPSYLAHYLNAETRKNRTERWRQYWELIKVHKVPDPNAATMKDSFHGHHSFHAFREEEAPEYSERSGDVYPLKRTELFTARAYLGEHPELHASLAMTQTIMCEYLDELKDALVGSARAKYGAQITDEEQILLTNLSSACSKLVQGAQAHSFLRDMSPIMACALSTQNLKSGDNWRPVLLFSFSRKAFQGKAPDGTDATCPFSEFFNRTLGVSVTGTEGHYEAAYGDLTQGFGNLVFFIHDRFSSEGYVKQMSLVAQEVAL